MAKEFTRTMNIDGRVVDLTCYRRGLMSEAEAVSNAIDLYRKQHINSHTEDSVLPSGQIVKEVHVHGQSSVRGLFANVAAKLRGTPDEKDSEAAYQEAKDASPLDAGVLPFMGHFENESEDWTVGYVHGTNGKTHRAMTSTEGRVQILRGADSLRVHEITEMANGTDNTWVGDWSDDDDAVNRSLQYQKQEKSLGRRSTVHTREQTIQNLKPKKEDDYDFLNGLY